MHRKQIVYAGAPRGSSAKALILLHGRGATAEDILGLSDHLHVQDFTIAAPQATNFSWYPFSFMAAPVQNEPWLGSALKLLEDLVKHLNESGVDPKDIFFSGFSQGACLTLEFVTRNARRWGGVAAFTGGLIGDRIYYNRYKGDFEGTPVFIGSADPDPHVPPGRVKETTSVLRDMNAAVKEAIYPGIGHTIVPQELAEANIHVFAASGKDR